MGPESRNIEYEEGYGIKFSEIKDRDAELKEKMKDLKERLFKECSSRTENLNTERVESYIRSLGLPMEDYFIFYDKDFDSISNFFKKEGFNLGDFENHDAAYYSLQQIVLVRRHETTNKVREPIFTEGLLIHELGHASSKKYDLAHNSEGFLDVPRVGFSAQNNGSPTGAFLEEGWADLLRGDYVTKHASTEFKKSVWDVLGNQGEWDGEARVFLKNELDEDEIEVLAKYLNLAEDGSITYSSQSIAATALELLVRKIPGLKEQLIAGRTELEALRKVLKLINELSPNLYPTLRSLNYNEEDFMKGLKIIQDVS